MLRPHPARALLLMALLLGGAAVASAPPAAAIQCIGIDFDDFANDPCLSVSCRKHDFIGIACGVGT